MSDFGWVHARWLILLLLVATAVSVVAIGAFLVTLPPTYFLKSHRRERGPDGHAVIRWAGKFLKNLAGVFLVLLGIVLTLPGVPGQGLLTVLIGLILLDFPGKRQLERRLILWDGIAEKVNRLRARLGRPPLILREPESPPGESAPTP